MFCEAANGPIELLVGTFTLVGGVVCTLAAVATALWLYVTLNEIWFPFGPLEPPPPEPSPKGTLDD